MVKPDLKHNYYQDLDLPTTASVDDVRKAYRKLALQFHPDRNAGREEECVPRFQAIQAANEILSDPTSKAKYDADRRKVGLYPSFSKPSAPASNPYAARSDFPPPPRRTAPGTWQRPGAPTQPTGADRFANFARTAGATPQKNPAADRTQQFRAWQNMKEPNTAPRPPPPDVPPRQYPPRSPQPPTPGAAPTSARPRMGRKDSQLPTEEKIRAGMRYGTGAGPSAEEAASHQSAWQAFQQQKAAGQTGPSSKAQRRQPPATPKRPGGFDPNAPGSDERPAPQSSHYVHRHRSEDLGRAGYPPPPPGPPPASTSHSPTSPNTQRPFADPLRPFKSRTSNEDAPYAEANRTSTPYSSVSGEKTAFTADGLRRSASVRDATKLSPESAKSTPSRARSVDPATRRKQANRGSPTNTARGAGFAAAMFSESDTEESSDDEDISKTPEEMPNTTQPSTTFSNTAQHGGPAPRKTMTPKPPSRLFNRTGTTSQVPPAADDRASHTDGEQPSMQQRKKSENIFAFPIDDDTFKPNPGKSRSVEEINTNFSPNGFSGRFEGSGDYFANTNSRRPSPAHRQSSRRSQRAATADTAPSSNGTSQVDSNSCYNGSGASLPGSNAPFSQEAWQKTFNDGGTFWPPPPPNPPVFKAPSRKSSRVNKANVRIPVAGTAKQPHLVDDDDNVVEVDRAGHPIHGSAAVEEPDAMDIDTPPQVTKTAPADQGIPFHPPSEKEARLYSVEPSEWRQQQQQAAQQQAQHHRQTSSSARRAERKSAGESSFNVNLDDLRHTEPFARNSEGLKNLSDLSSTLPFASKPSSTLPAEMPHLSRAMIKAAPAVPEGPVSLTRTSWEKYAQEFANYLAKFHNWNQEYLRHFDSFDREAHDRTKNGCGWLLQNGDSAHGLGGFGAYRRSIQEEHQSREAWAKGREVHLEALKDFEKVRNRVRYLVEAGNLADV